jgi:glucose dehydrogenase
MNPHGYDLSFLVLAALLWLRSAALLWLRSAIILELGS